jgi:protein-S-isoprenylcysteine O-methyltransferase Ste14
VWLTCNKHACLWGGNFAVCSVAVKHACKMLSSCVAVGCLVCMCACVSLASGNFTHKASHAVMAQALKQVVTWTMVYSP